jgi:hypothetical protein
VTNTPPQVGAPSVSELIVEYLMAHPSAADTAEGIRSMWLGGLASPVEVEAALELLVARGRVVGRLLPDGAVLFARAVAPTP